MSLHLSLLITLPKQDPPKKQDKPHQVDVKHRDVEFIEKETDNPNALHISCPHTYEGIGIKRNFGNVVTQVAPGWPADKAGIKPGDSVEPWSIWPENGYMEFELIRDGVRKKMRLKTAQICFRDGPF